MVDVAAIRQRFSAVAPFLNERGRRVVAAAEASAHSNGEFVAIDWDGDSDSTTGAKIERQEAVRN